MKLNRVTIAITDMNAMVNFYNAVFQCDLQPIPETPFFVGHFASIPLLFCPNSIAEVHAEKNRIQFDVVVDDIDAVVAEVRQAGGSTYDDRQDSAEKIVWGIIDPDGNSLVLIQPKA